MTARIASRLEAVFVAIAGLSLEERALAVARIIPTLDVAGLERVPGPLFAALTELAKADPREAGRLASALWAHLVAHRPESPCPLDSGFKPTEPIRDPRGNVG